MARREASSVSVCSRVSWLSKSFWPRLGSESAPVALTLLLSLAMRWAYEERMHTLACQGSGSPVSHPKDLSLQAPDPLDA
jgi:hypothetical protein